MNLRPLYDRIVVKRIEEQETTRKGIVIADSAQEKTQEGEARAVGHGTRLENGTLFAHSSRRTRTEVPAEPRRIPGLMINNLR